MKRRSVYALLAVLALSACATTTPAPQPFERSIYQAAVFRPENLRELKPVVADANGEVLVTTVKPSPWNLGATQLGGAVWISLVPEVKDRCKTFPPDVLAMRLRQILGLQPTQTVTHFITMKVRAVDLFRPTPDPRTDTIYPCLDPVKKTGCNVFPVGANDEEKERIAKHKQWMAETFLTLQIPNGFPWTHLGYTYNWAPGADPYGASEYLVRSGSNVEVTEATPIGEYCR